MPFTLPELPYEYSALEPHIDARTMEIHYTKHHQTYIDKLTAALQGTPAWQEKSIEDILTNLEAVPAEIRSAVRNHGGGHANHSLFWTVMSPDGGGEPRGALAEALSSTFGDVVTFQKQFTETATGQFGSGWAWLAWRDGELKVLGLPNQDSPLSQGAAPLLGVDVWEHAYYLKYQQKRADYIAAWWKVVNWDEVARRYEAVAG